MAKSSGLGDGFYVGGYELAGDIGAVENVRGGPAPLVVTGINKSAEERIGGVRDGAIEFTAWFNPATDRAHSRLKLLPTTDTLVTYTRGTAVGAASASCMAKQVNYDPTRGTDGSLSFKVQALANGYGVEWGTILASAIQGSAGATSGVDYSASSAFGLQAYLQLTAFTGTSITVAIQESSDNAGADPYANVTGGVFSAMTAIGDQRIATANNLTVERWLRINTTGTFSAAAFLVTVVRNAIAGQVF